MARKYREAEEQNPTQPKTIKQLRTLGVLDATIEEKNIRVPRWMKWTGLPEHN